MSASFPHFHNIENSTAEKLLWCLRFILSLGRSNDKEGWAIVWNSMLSRNHGLPLNKPYFCESFNQMCPNSAVRYHKFFGPVLFSSAISEVLKLGDFTNQKWSVCFFLGGGEWVKLAFQPELLEKKCLDIGSWFNHYGPIQMDVSYLPSLKLTVCTWKYAIPKGN